MKFSDISLPEVYKDSYDFRFFVKWFSYCLEGIKSDTENLIDLLDPQRCPSELLWMLGDTMGYKYDSRFLVSFNRLVLTYFMSLIYNRGSKTGMTLAAEINLAQFDVNSYAEENEAYRDRLKDTTIPINACYMTGHPDQGYIDIVYYSENIPKDACFEYVRPLGMFTFTHAGIRVDSRTKISVDPRLTGANSIFLGVGPTRVGHYRRADYASIQKMVDNSGNPDVEKRHLAWYRNGDYEGQGNKMIDPGLRSLYSVQLCNNEHIVKALMPSLPIYTIGEGPTEVGTLYPDNYYKTEEDKLWNLRVDREAEEELGGELLTFDDSRTESIINPRPAVNPIMANPGDAIRMTPDGHRYLYQGKSGKYYSNYIWYTHPDDDDDIYNLGKQDKE